MVVLVWFTTTPKKQRDPLEVPYMFSMSHTSGINPTNGSSTSTFEESPSNDDVGGIGGWNRIPPPRKSFSKLVFEI